MIAERKIIKSKDLSAKLARNIMQFAEGESKPVKLPSERQLAEKFSVSRRQIRLAIGRLEDKGLIVRKHGSGNYLLPKRIRTETVNFIIPEGIKADDPFYGTLIAQFFLYAHENNIKLVPVKISSQTLINPDIPVILPAIPNERELDILVKCERNSKIISLFDIPNQPKNNDFCWVFYDDHLIGKQAAEIIAEYNHRNVLFLSGIKTKVNSAIKRHQSFLTRANELGLDVTVYECKMNYRGGYEAMREFLRAYRDIRAAERPTAIFASTDWTAAGAYQAIWQEGHDIPDDFSVIGCDDVPLSRELKPELSTFRLDTYQLASQVFALIEQSWRMELPEKIILRPKFIKRQSLCQRQ